MSVSNPEAIVYPAMPRTRTLVQAVPEHEIVLVFNDDDTAAAFAEWLQDEGWVAFTRQAARKPA